MKLRTFLVGLLVVIGLIGGGYLYVQQLITLPPLPSYDTTIISGKPAAASCINKGGKAPLAIELIDLGADVVYLAGGANPISEATWDTTTVRFPQMKNSKRYLLFDDSCLYRSPDKPATCQGEACSTFVELYHHTWFLLNRLAGQQCYPATKGCYQDGVEAGYLSITTIDKCQELTWNGPTIYVLDDHQGNRYIMHATATGTPDLAQVVLPMGWTVRAETISTPLTIQPRGAGHCYYNIVRDNLVQSYHQYSFADTTFPPAAWAE
ncbi:MAG: hypothetical protein KF832_05505 [Caldilineaceae bacterium]|nr:hypothetical protein [Caldilineaceae bacterium]